MILASNLPLRGFRKDPFVATMIVTGKDLTGAAMSFAVRQYPDQPGAALIEIGEAAAKGAEGIRLVSVGLDVDGFPQSALEIIISKTKMQALPQPGVDAAGEIGDPLELSYDLQITPADSSSSEWTENIEQTWLYGAFIVNGSVNS